MSIVAVKNYKDKIVIGSDSITVRGWTQSKEEFCKMKKVNDELVVAGVGKARDFTLFYEYSKTRKPRNQSYNSILDYFNEFHEWLRKKIKNNNEDLTKSAFIMVYLDKAYYFNEYYLEEIKDYEAIGAGMDYALSALYLNKTVKDAIEVACELSVFCEKPINIIEVKK